MAYKPVDRSFDSNYLKEQHRAMRWLAEQGLTTEEIREFHWGNVVETERMLRLTKTITNIRLDLATGVTSVRQTPGEIMVPLSGTPYEHFFLKSRIWCHWAFLKEKPRTWRREGSRESIYSLFEVATICRSTDYGQLSGNALTNLLKFGTIEISKLNITKMETRGQGMQEAELVKA